ncbi:MAG: hypothetical protein R3E79_61460 [Caldilineaceae bacterium]
MIVWKGQQWTQIRHRSALWLLVVLVLGWVTPVAAHGSGTPRLVNVIAGPYRLWVWSLPDPIRVGEVHISVAVEEVASPPTPQTMPTDFAVQLTISALDQSHQPFTLSASKQERFLQTYYEADFTMPAVGQWQADISITGPAGVGAMAFPFAVLPPQRVNWILVLWSIVAVVATGWVLRGNRRAAARESAESGPPATHAGAVTLPPDSGRKDQ